MIESTYIYTQNLKRLLKVIFVLVLKMWEKEPRTEQTIFTMKCSLVKCQVKTYLTVNTRWADQCHFAIDVFSNNNSLNVTLTPLAALCSKINLSVRHCALPLRTLEIEIPNIIHLL